MKFQGAKKIGGTDGIDLHYGLGYWAIGFSVSPSWFYPLIGAAVKQRALFLCLHLPFVVASTTVWIGKPRADEQGDTSEPIEWPETIEK